MRAQNTKKGLAAASANAGKGFEYGTEIRDRVASGVDNVNTGSQAREEALSRSLFDSSPVFVPRDKCGTVGAKL
jgi:hypothetical protein